MSALAAGLSSNRLKLSQVARSSRFQGLCPVHRSPIAMSGSSDKAARAVSLKQLQPPPRMPHRRFSRRERRRIAPDGVRHSGRNPGKAPPSRPRPVGPRRTVPPAIMRPASRRCALKGHDFSRAANQPQRSSASAAEGCLPRFLRLQEISAVGALCIRI
jgi:hypothetical protein